MVDYASKKGVKLTIERYGVKAAAEEEESKSEDETDEKNAE
jgi:hypothetical protein